MNAAAETTAYIPGCYAAIDIGTVTCRLLVADVDATGGLSVLRRGHMIANLGIGVDAQGLLAQDAIERVGSCIDGFAKSILEVGRAGDQVKLRAIATSAARDAANADELKARIAKAGVELDVIAGGEEARLSFSGATAAFPGQKCIVIDVGGGSTEIIAGEAGGAPQFAHSFQIGCRRVTERYLHEDPPTAAELSEAATWIAAEMKEYLTRLRENGFADARYIAVAGTATTVVSMREQMEVYDSARVHGTVVSRADIDALIERLAAITLEERREVIGLEPQRAPVIIAGLLILQQILEVSGIDEFTVSEYDILHGVVLSLARA